MTKPRRGFMFQCRTVTTVLRSKGYPVELVNGRGYFYFIYDDGVKYNTYSICTMRLHSMSFEQWVEHGELFAKEMKDKS